MTFFGLILRNLWSKKARSIRLGLRRGDRRDGGRDTRCHSSGLEQSAAAIMSVGKADFTVAQKGASSTLDSTIDRTSWRGCEQTPGVATVVGVLVETEHINADNPVFIEIGISPGDLTAFGVRLVAGHPYGSTAAHEVMLGWRAAANFGLHVGDRFDANGTWNTVVGHLLDRERVRRCRSHVPPPGDTGLQPGARDRHAGLRQGQPGASVGAVTARSTMTSPSSRPFGRPPSSEGRIRTWSTSKRQSTGARCSPSSSARSSWATPCSSPSSSGRVSSGSSERSAGPGDARSSLLLGESTLLAIAGACLGVALSFVVAVVLENLPVLKGVLHPNFTEGAFWQGALHGARHDTCRRLVSDDSGGPSLAAQGPEL